MTLPSDSVQRGIAALKAGDRSAARACFREALLKNANDEQAWLWMSGVVASTQEQRDCLQRVLSINPANATARRGLAALDAASAAAAPAATPSPSPAPAAPATPPTGGRQGSPLPPASAAVSAPAAPSVAVPPRVPAIEVPAAPAALVERQAPEPQVETGPPRPTAAAQLANEKARQGAARVRKPDGYQYKVNERIGAFQVVERVGTQGDRELYLAVKDDPTWLFWLISDATPPQMAVKAQQERFEIDGWPYLAVAIAGTSVADLISIMPTVRFRFIGPRWVQLADNIGYLHKQGQIYQQSTPLALDNVVFNGQGVVTAMSFNRAAAGANAFAAPEARQMALLPASDVYSLAAALLAVMGQGAPETTFASRAPRLGLLKSAPELFNVLKKATDLEPKKRYPDGERFARALEGLLSRLPAEAEAALAKPPVRRRAVGLVGVLATGLLLALIAFGVWRFGPQPQQGEVLPVPVPADGFSLPVGDLVISGFTIDFGSSEAAIATVQMMQNGEPLAESARPRLLLQRNGSIVGGQRMVPDETGRYAINFEAPQPAAGLYRVVAELNGARTELSRYFAPTNDPGLGENIRAVNLAELRADGLQVDTQSYPDVTSYFAVVTVDGDVGRLLGTFDVEVLQDGQPVTDFSLEAVDTAREPVTVAMVVDVSGSMSGAPIELARQGAAAFVDQLGPNDSACLYTFATLVRLVVECTTDKQVLISAIEGLQTIDDTALYDALVRVTTDQSQRSGRLAIVVLSDGSDTRSQASFDQALQNVQASSIPVYTIGLLSEQFDGSILRTLAENADAIYLEAPNPDAVAELYGQVESQLASQYKISFRSIFPDRQSGEITIRVKQGDEVIEITRSFTVQ